jgi:hypothetical protein
VLEALLGRSSMRARKRGIFVFDFSKKQLFRF